MPCLRDFLFRSHKGEFNTGSNTPQQLLSPSTARPQLPEGSERTATPNRKATPITLEPTPEPTVVEPKVEVELEPKSEMAPKQDVLEAKHAERVLVVGKGVILTANVTSCDKVVVEGSFQGNIKTGTFVLAEGEKQIRGGVDGGTIFQFSIFNRND